MLYRVKDLSPEQRHAAEVLLGHAVSDDEAVSVKSLNPSSIIPSSLSPEERIAAMRALDERFATSQVPEVSEEEEDELVRDAFRSTTHLDYRPVR
jgi:hypothetical protein